MIDTFGGAKQKQNMLRRKKHGINKEMIVDALDAAGMESVAISEPTTPSTPIQQGQYSVSSCYSVSNKISLKGYSDKLSLFWHLKSMIILSEFQTGFSLV